MSEQSNNQGRAYEYICLTTLYNEIGKLRSVEIEQNSAYNAAFHAWSLITPLFQNVLTESAQSAVATIYKQISTASAVMFVILLLVEKMCNGKLV